MTTGASLKKLHVIFKMYRDSFLNFGGHMNFMKNQVSYNNPFYDGLNFY